MRTIIANAFVSLDLVMQGPSDPEEDRDGGFDLGGWFMPYWHDDIGTHVLESMSTYDAILLGRKTYEMHAAAFAPIPAAAGDPVAGHMNNTRKYLVSTTLQRADWQNTTLISKDVADAVRALKQQPGQTIEISGSCTLVHALLQADLIDEVGLTICPVVLGQGKRIFPAGYHAAFKVAETKTFPSGANYMRLQRDR